MTQLQGVALDNHPRSNSTEIEISSGEIVNKIGEVVAGVGDIVEIRGFYHYGSDVRFWENQALTEAEQAKANKINRLSYIDRL